MPEMNPRQRTRPRKWKRTSAAALLLLAGGAVVNVAVAWGCTRWSTLNDAETLDVEVVPSLFKARGMLEPVRSIDGQMLRGFGLRMVEGAGLTSVVVEGRDRQGPVNLITFDAGWPFLSLRAEWRTVVTIGNEVSSEFILHQGIETQRRPRDGQDFGGKFTYPSYPLLPGFIINTLFYALLLWLLIFAPGSARRMLRRRRGLCEKCAYPIGVSPVCTECGAAVRTSVATKDHRSASSGSCCAARRAGAE